MHGSGRASKAADRLVGRTAELELLRSCLDSASGGRPVVMMCVGEPGIGKTRLAEAMGEAAGAAGFVQAWGLGDEAEGAPPFWPWIRILRQLAQETRVREHAEHFLAEALEVLSGRDVGEYAADAQARFRRFETVAEALREVAAASPTLIILDDAHWVDESSILLLQHVTRGLRSERLCVVVTMRATDPRVRAMRSDLLRSPFARELSLHGLPASGVREYLHAAGLLADDADAERVHELTGGNPLFLAEYTRTYRTGGLSPTVRETIARRIRTLPADTSRVLASAAVLGPEFLASEVSEVAGTTQTHVQAALDDLDLAGLVAPTAAGRYRFVHSLVRDAVESGLGHADRAALHRQAARIAEGRPEPDLFAVAHHLAEAADGDPAGALVAIRRAADEAMRRLAFEPAVRLYRLALSIGADLDPAEQFELSTSLQRASHDAGDLGERLASATRAASLARQIGRGDLLAEVALGMPPVGHIGFDLATRRLCTEALDAVDPQDLRLRAMLSACYAETFNYQAEALAGRRASRAALELAEASGEPTAVMAACRSFQTLFAGPDDLDTRAEIAERMIRVADATQDAHHELAARTAWTTVLLERGDLDGAADQVAASSVPTEKIGTPDARLHLLLAQATLAQARGRVAEARRLADAAHAAAGGTGLPNARHGRAALLGNLGRHAGHDDTTLSASGDSAAPNPGGAPPVIAGIALAHSLVTAGHTAEAAEVYDALGSPRHWRPAPHVTLLCAAMGIAVASELGRGEDLPVFVERLADYRGHHVVSGIGALAYLGPVELWLGTAARNLGNLSGALEDLQEARDICERVAALGFQCDAEIEMAAALVARGAPGDARRARQLIAHATAVADSHRMAGVRQRADSVRTQPTGTSLLTRREWEVAGLVAAGLTNRQIGERLVLSERTAQNHVQHILDKLGVNTRSAIATWVAENRCE